MYENICEMLGIEYPIIQGAMAWIATPELVAAVSNAGGLGVLATGHLNGEGCREAIHKLKEMTDRPYAVNIMLLSAYAEEIIFSPPPLYSKCYAGLMRLTKSPLLYESARCSAKF